MTFKPRLTINHVASSPGVRSASGGQGRTRRVGKHRHTSEPVAQVSPTSMPYSASRRIGVLGWMAAAFSRFTTASSGFQAAQFLLAVVPYNHGCHLLDAQAAIDPLRL